MNQLIISSREFRRRELEEKRGLEGPIRLYSDHSFKMLVPLASWSYYAGRACGLALPENLQQYEDSLKVDPTGNLFDPFNNLDDYLLIYDWLEHEDGGSIVITKDYSNDSYKHKYTALRVRDNLNGISYAVYTHIPLANGESEAFRLSFIRTAAYLSRIHAQSFFKALKRNMPASNDIKLYKYDTLMDS